MPSDAEIGALPEGPAQTGVPPQNFPIVPTPVTGLSPAQRVSTPNHLDWHMIQDHELSQLSGVETGTVASLGFVGMGAAIGLAGPFLAALSKITANPPIPVSLPDIYYLVSLSGSMVLALVCLVIAGLAKWRNKGLAAEIRRRPKHGLRDTN